MAAVQSRKPTNDAEAICEAVTRPNMRFVPVKTEDQQALPALHRSRDLLMRQRTMILNAIRAHLAEFGMITAQRPRKVIEFSLNNSEAIDFVRRSGGFSRHRLQGFL